MLICVKEREWKGMESVADPNWVDPLERLIQLERLQEIFEVCGDILIDENEIY